MRPRVVHLRCEAAVLVARSARGRGPDLLEAGAAVHRLVAAGLERDTRLTAAVAARCGEELARATHATAAAVHSAAGSAARGPACGAARRASTRLVHETTGLGGLLL